MAHRKTLSKGKASKTRTDEQNFSPLAKSLLRGIREAVAYKRGELHEADGVIVHNFPRVPDYINVKAIRKKLGLTQEEFAQFGFSVGSIRNWEQGLREPEGSAKVLLKVIEQNPKVVFSAIAHT